MGAPAPAGTRKAGPVGPQGLKAHTVRFPHGRGRHFDDIPNKYYRLHRGWTGLMGHALTVYAVAALLVAASAGPVLATVRDASLLEFEALDEPQTLNDFPLLERVEAFLPPMIVDWLIIRPDSDLNIPDDVGYRVDADGRVILVWPDGCEETQEQFRDESVCDEVAPDCEATPLDPDCPDGPLPCPDGDNEPAANGTATDCAPIEECPTGQIFDDGEGECVIDPECHEDNPTRGDHCPPIEPVPTPTCAPGFVETYDGDCIATITHRLRTLRFEGTNNDEKTVYIELKAHYQNLSLEIERGGLLNPGWQATLYHEEEGQLICWVPKEDPEAESDCEPAQSSGTSSAPLSLIDHQDPAPIPPGNLTLHVEYNPSASPTSQQMELQLLGRPTSHDAG